MLDTLKIVTSKSDETVFDRADLYDRVMGDEELLAEILELFVDDGAQQIERIRQAVERSDASLIASAAHALKGAAGNISAPVLARAAAALEGAAKTGKLADTTALVAQIEEAFERFKQALES